MILSVSWLRFFRLEAILSQKCRRLLGLLKVALTHRVLSLQKRDTAGYQCLQAVFAVALLFEPLQQFALFGDARFQLGALLINLCLAVLGDARHALYEVSRFIRYAFAVQVLQNSI